VAAGCSAAEQQRGAAVGGGPGSWSPHHPRSCRRRSRRGPRRQDPASRAAPEWGGRSGHRYAPSAGSPPSDASGSSEATPLAAAVRPRARNDPCAAGQRGSRGPRGSASGGGNHGSGSGAGCSAGTFACSREDSHYRRDLNLQMASEAGGRVCPATPAVPEPQVRKRPSNGTGRGQAGQTAEAGRLSRVTTRHVQSTRRMTSEYSKTACKTVRALLASRCA
jgi:hypothetical protein